MSQYSKQPSRRTGDTTRPTTERLIIPSQDIEKKSYKPALAPVDQVVEPEPPAPSPKPAPKADK
jgi:hypothetical protein